MNTNQLESFISIAQTLNYSEAAKNAFISQPALTKQINRLESELGVRLFDRSKHGVSLTFAGEEFYKYAVDIIDGIKQAGNRMQNIRDGQTGFLKISSVYSMERLISRSVSDYSERFPDVSVSILIGTGTSQIMTIQKMTYDVFFSFSSLLDSFPDICQMPLPSDRFAVFLHRKYKKAYEAEGVGLLNRLRHFVELSSEGPFLTNRTFALMDACGIANENIVYYPSSTAMLIAVQAGMGFALLPMEMNHCALPRDVLAFPLDLPEAVIERAFGWHKSNKNAALKSFIQCICDQGGFDENYNSQTI